MLDEIRAESFEPLLHEKAANTFIRLRPDDREVCDGAVGDPHLRAIQNPISALLARERLHVRWIRSAVRFGESEAADHFACSHLRQPALLLFFAPECVDRIHAQARLHGDETAQARIAAFELLADEAVRDSVQSGASIAVNRASQEAKLCDAGNELLRKALVLEAFADDGNDLIVDVLGDGVLHHPFVLAQHRAHVVQIDRIEFGGGQGLGDCRHDVHLGRRSYRSVLYTSRPRRALWSEDCVHRCL